MSQCTPSVLLKGARPWAQLILKSKHLMVRATRLRGHKRVQSELKRSRYESAEPARTMKAIASSRMIADSQFVWEVRLTDVPGGSVPSARFRHCYPLPARILDALRPSASSRL